MVTNLGTNGNKTKIGLTDLLLSDPEVMCHLGGLNRKQATTKILTAVKIGLIAMERIENASDLDYVRSEFERMNTRFGDKLDLQFKVLDEGLEKRLESLDLHFNPNHEDSYLFQFSRTLEEYFASGGTVEKLFDLEQENTPLGQLKKLQEERTREILDAILIRKTQQETILKGEDFEDDCENILAEIVSTTGEELERTSLIPGTLNNDKTGDFVISLKDQPAKRIALEMKAGESRHTLPKLLTTLDNALENREAQYAILVAENVEALPKSLGYMKEYGQNKLVIAVGSQQEDSFFPEMLTIGLQLARMRLQTISSQNQAIDSGKLSVALDELSSALDRFSQIKSQCSNIEKSSQNIRELVGEIKEKISTKLGWLHLLIEKSN